MFHVAFNYINFNWFLLEFAHFFHKSGPEDVAQLRQAFADSIREFGEQNMTQGSFFPLDHLNFNV